MVRFKALSSYVTHSAMVQSFNSYMVRFKALSSLQTGQQSFGFNSYMVRFKVKETIWQIIILAEFQFLYGSI